MKPKLLLQTDHYTEGIVVHPDGSIFFSMTSIGTISRLNPANGLASIWAHVPAPNGHKIQADGTHILMASVGAIVRLDNEGKTEAVLASKVDEHWLVYPNDVALDLNRGIFYFTDSGYKTMPTQMPADPIGCVYYVDAKHSVRRVADQIAYANGIALSHDGSLLYVGESLTRKIWTYRVDHEGSLGAKKLFAETPPTDGSAVPDGITIAPDSCVYVAHYGAREILVYSPQGELLERLDAGNKAVSHCAFSSDGRVLYVSGGLESEQGAGAIFAIAR